MTKEEEFKLRIDPTSCPDCQGTGRTTNTGCETKICLCPGGMAILEKNFRDLKKQGIKFEITDSEWETND